MRADALGTGFAWPHSDETIFHLLPSGSPRMGRAGRLSRVQRRNALCGMIAVGARRKGGSDEESMDANVMLGPTSAGLQIRF